jgi:hypothetical protein
MDSATGSCPWWWLWLWLSREKMKGRAVRENIQVPKGVQVEIILAIKLAHSRLDITWLLSTGNRYRKLVRQPDWNFSSGNT